MNRASLLTALVVSAGLPQMASAQGIFDPAHTFAKVADLQDVPTYVAPPIDFAEVAMLEAMEASENKPARFAVADEVAISPATHGLWEELPGGKYSLWRMRVTNDNAVSLNFGFLSYHLPQGARMLIYPTFGAPEYRAFTAEDNADHAQLWTPVTSGNDAIIEVLVPTAVADQVFLDLGAVNTGYRGFGLSGALEGKSGSCNVDVVCPDGMGWENEIAASGAYSINGSFACSGSMINNTEDRDYFLTADHCGVSTGNDQSMVVYWNYQNSTCRTPGSGASGGNGNGSLTQFNSGTIWRDDSSSSDYTVVEMEEAINPAYMVSKAGWDRSGANATTAVAIHHPGVEEKRISFEFQPTTITNYLSDSVNPSGTHVRVDDWDTGTTEPGSSGSPLFDQNHRIIGQLHGGFAACGNNDPDWYGRVSVSWGAGLQQLLAPGNPGLMTMDTDGDFTPSGLSVTPQTDFAASGPIGGPFVGNSVVYVVENTSETETYTYAVTEPASWLSVTNGSGSLSPLSSANVTVSLNGAANGLAAGAYASTITFSNLTDGDGNTTRDASLDVGSIFYGGSGFSIPDNGSISRTINIPDSFEIADVEIDLDITHTWVGDLIFTIAHNGTDVVLVDRPGMTTGCCGTNQPINGLYTFSDESSTPWENLGSFPAGVYQPFEPLNEFDGGDAQGNWTITISDNAGQDTGSVASWGVRLVPAEGPACTGDIADDFGVLGADGMVSFGDFLALLGLVGPCPGGTPGCTGDIADDFGILGGDGMVSFGDFLALLGLVGPCP